jgi:hypothetical protein
LAKLDDGQPLLVERVVGAGSVLLLGCGVHVEWTNLPLKPLFLPLLTRLTFQLAGAETERTTGLAGAPLTLPLGKRAGKAQGQVGNAELEVVRPSGEVLRIHAADETAESIRYAETHEAGVYLVRSVDRMPPKQMAFAVNIDPAESDPTSLTREQLEARFGKRPLIFCENPSDLAETIHRLREGTSLWEWFLAAVLVGLVFEVLLANRGASQPTGATTAASQPSAVVTSEAAPDQQREPKPDADELRGFLEHLEQNAAKARLRE